MSSSSNLALAELRDGPLYRFADWPNPEVPNGRIGVYTVWRGDQLIYVGMAGRALGPSADTSGPGCCQAHRASKPSGIARIRTPVR
jgi:hypothetical protein